MTASKYIKGLLTGAAAVALIGTAMAQGTPPNPAKSAPIGAGQQSSQGTPMGTTGTPGGSATGAMPSGSTSSGTNSGSASAPMTSGNTSMGSGSTAADTSTAGRNARTSRPMRTARADRN